MNHVLRLFRPRAEGTLTLGEVPADFTDRIRDRVEQGLLMRGSRVRANYAVRERTGDSIAFGAEDWWTAVNIGLNEVKVRREDTKTLAYTVRFPKWMGYTAGLCGAVAGFIAISVGVGGILGKVPAGTRLPANVSVVGGIVLWGAAWPWLLASLHKRHLRRFMERMLREELDREPGSTTA
jgi:Flp pilus assembly protein TadB